MWHVLNFSWVVHVILPSFSAGFIFKDYKIVKFTIRSDRFCMCHFVDLFIIPHISSPQSAHPRLCFYRNVTH